MYTAVDSHVSTTPSAVVGRNVQRSTFFAATRGVYRRQNVRA
jgi:hypothetical protein